MTRLPACLLAAQVVLALALAPCYALVGLTVDWRSAMPLAAAHALVANVWWYLRRYDTHPTKWIFRDVILAAGALLLPTNILSPAQYAAVAVQRPFIDASLARADAALGIDVSRLAAWTAAHPMVSATLSACYGSLSYQFLLVLTVVGLRFRDRARLWEFVFHFQCCLIVTIAALAVFPAACAPAYFGFTPTIDQARVVTQIAALHAGTFTTVDFGALEGLVSMPSFHTAGALIVTWAFRDRWRWWVPLAVLNTGLIAATFMSGVHYFVDVLGAMVLCGASLLAYRGIIGRALPVQALSVQALSVREEAAAPTVAAGHRLPVPQWRPATHASTD